MAKAVQSTEFERQNLGSRKVWVLNRDTEDYSEEFRGQTVTVPANMKKELLMPFLEARRFLGQPKAPANIKVDGTYDTRPKALLTVELTDEEMEEIEGLSKKAIDQKVKAENKKASQELSASLKKVSGSARPVSED